MDSIRWYAGYSGVKSKILDFNVETGDKETPPLSFITVDGDSATDDEVRCFLHNLKSPKISVF